MSKKMDCLPLTHHIKCHTSTDKYCSLVGKGGGKKSKPNVGDLGLNDNFIAGPFWVLDWRNH